MANDVAAENFAEATIGHPDGETETAALWQLLFDRPNFKINVLPDVDGVEVSQELCHANVAPPDAFSTCHHCWWHNSWACP